MMFHQQVAGDDKAKDWSKLNSSLYAVSFLAQSVKAKSCTLCMEADHGEEDCTLARQKPRDHRPGGSQGFRQPPASSSTSSSNRLPKGREGHICYSFNQVTALTRDAATTMCASSVAADRILLFGARPPLAQSVGE